MVAENAVVAKRIGNDSVVDGIYCHCADVMLFCTANASPPLAPFRAEATAMGFDQRAYPVSGRRDQPAFARS